MKQIRLISDFPNVAMNTKTHIGAMPLKSLMKMWLNDFCSQPFKYKDDKKIFEHLTTQFLWVFMNKLLRNKCQSTKRFMVKAKDCKFLGLKEIQVLVWLIL